MSLVGRILRQRRFRHGIMRLVDDGDPTEDEPMLSPSSRSVHGTIEIDDSPRTGYSTGSNNRPKTPGSTSAVYRWAQGRFRILYLVLVILLLIALAVLIVAIFLAVKVKKMDDKYENVSKTVGDQFRRMYEQVNPYRTGRHGTFKDVSALSAVLSPEQLAQAKQFGLIPETSNELAPGIPGLAPIRPVTDPTGQQNDDAVPTTSQPMDTAAEGQVPPWASKDCNARCEKADFANAPLVIISLDGFAREYLDRGLVPSLKHLTNCGSRAEFMFPSYPSKTFPNHYSIATGLYPESHGVVDNAVYDPEVSPELEDMKRTKFAELYHGDPIWSLAVRHGHKMFCLFWPGCSFNITGYNPTMDLPYNRSLMYSQRVDMILDWLRLPANDRPSLIMAYFDQPDYVGHFHTTDQQVNLELQYIESVLYYLFTSLHRSGLMDCVNVVVLSDHGMQFLHKRIFVDQVVDSKGMIVATGVVGRIYLANSTSSTTEVVDKFKCPADKSYRVFDRAHMPTRYHYAQTARVGDVVLDGRLGTTFYPSKSGDYGVTSDHGYDYLEPEMHAIFFAHGPNIATGARVPPFQNIELYNLFVDLLKLPHEVPNNGTVGLLKPFLRNTEPLHPPRSFFLHPVQPCFPFVLFQKREVQACAPNDSLCDAKTGFLNSVLDTCQVHQPPTNFFHVESPDFCLLDLCAVSLVSTQRRSNKAVPLAAFETLTAQEIVKIEKARDQERPKTQNCLFIDRRFDDCKNITVSNKSKMRVAPILANTNAELNDLHRLQFSLYEGFVRGPMTYLQNVTHAYAKKYTRLAVVSGTIFDYDHNGRADAMQPSDPEVPSHIFRLILRCANNQWNVDGYRCREEESTRVLAFVVPNQPTEDNCLEPMDYLLQNSARVRDIELLTGIEFFQEPTWYSALTSLRIRTNITEALWPL